MLKETRTYVDFNGVERTEDFYFNLSKAELAEMELSNDGGLDKLIQKIVNAKDNKKVVEMFKEIILKAYGVKSDDGRRFIKSKELSKEFSETPVYSDMFIEFATDEEKASKFIDGIMPKDLKDQIEEAEKKRNLNSVTNA